MHIGLYRDGPSPCRDSSPGCRSFCFSAGCSTPSGSSSPPRRANVIAKLAHGIADDALSTIALALRPEAKVLIAPAMNGKMWLHPATQANVKLLQSRGVEFIGPDKGMLACGYEGIGRLWDVDQDRGEDSEDAGVSMP